MRYCPTNGEQSQQTGRHKLRLTDRYSRPETISYREVEEVENSRSGSLLVTFPQCYTTDKRWWLVSYGCVAPCGGLCESVPLRWQSLVSADVHIQAYWPLCFQVILLCLPSCSRSTGIMVVSTRCHCAQLSMVPRFEFRQSCLHSHAVLQLNHLCIVCHSSPNGVRQSLSLLILVTCNLPAPPTHLFLSFPPAFLSKFYWTL